MQSKLMSFIEAWANVLVGISISFISGIVIYKWMGVHVTLMQNVEITAYFTAISLARSYLIRRWFNAKTN